MNICLNSSLKSSWGSCRNRILYNLQIFLEKERRNIRGIIGFPDENPSSVWSGIEEELARKILGNHHPKIVIVVGDDVRDLLTICRCN